MYCTIKIYGHPHDKRVALYNFQNKVLAVGLRKSQWLWFRNFIRELSYANFRPRIYVREFSSAVFRMIRNVQGGRLNEFPDYKL